MCCAGVHIVFIKKKTSDSLGTPSFCYFHWLVPYLSVFPQDPGKAIPKGTLTALAVSTTSYLVMAVLSGTGALRDASGSPSDFANANISACKPKCEYGLHNNYAVTIRIVSVKGFPVFRHSALLSWNNISFNRLKCSNTSSFFFVNFLDNATNGTMGSSHLRRVLGGDIVHGADKSAVRAAADPGAGHRLYLPWPYLLLQALRPPWGALSWLCPHFHRFITVPTYWWVFLMETW